MQALAATVSESEEIVTVEVSANRNVDAHVIVRLFSAPSDGNPPATGMVNIYHVNNLH